MIAWRLTEVSRLGWIRLAWLLTTTLNIPVMATVHGTDDITRIQEQLASNARQRQHIEQELEHTERSIGQLLKDSRETARELVEASRNLQQLHTDYHSKQSTLDRHLAQLGSQLRAAYSFGHQEQLRVILSQESPERLSRSMVYLRYLADARMTLIEQVRASLSQLDALRPLIEQDQARLNELATRQDAELQTLEQRRSERHNILAALDKEYQSKHWQLIQMQQDTQQLSRTVDQLTANTKAPVVPGSPRRALRPAKGHLPWPLQGRILQPFGSSRAKARSSTGGVLIAAQPGTEVRAWYAGRVVFADWMKGFGLLLILEHEDGLMSVYGHNEALLKSVGDTVGQSEPVAVVGGSGGRNDTALYFAIRDHSRPVNPAEWCSSS